MYISHLPNFLAEVPAWEKRGKDSNLINRTKIYSAIFSDVSLNVN